MKIHAIRSFKLLIFIICLVLVSPIILIVRAEQLLSKSEAVFTVFAHLLSLLPAKPGNFFRSAYYFGTLDHCSWETDIGFGSILSHRGSILGKNVSTGCYCIIGHAEIGDGVRMASRVSIPSGKRQHLDESGQLSEVTNYDRVQIGRECWIGEAAIIMATVGKGSIISAGAVVINAIADNSIAGGNPAKVLKELRADRNSMSRD